MTELPTMRESLAGEVTRQIDRIAAQLRDLAIQVERHRVDIDRAGRGGPPTAGAVAATVLHDVLNASANLPLDTLVRAAGNYDTHAREED